MPTIALDSTEEGALGLCLVRFKHELIREAPQDERDASVLSAPNAPREPTCKNTLRYRYATLGYWHAFWQLRDDYDNLTLTVSGGPTGDGYLGAIGGHLHVWQVVGPVGHYPEDNPSALFYKDFPGCYQLSLISQKADTFPQNQYTYTFTRTSNSVAHSIAVLAGWGGYQKIETGPPDTMGWNTIITW